MSSPLTPEQRAELRRLIQVSLDERFTPEDYARLQEWVCRDEEAGRIYVQYMHLHARLHWSETLELEPGPPPLREEAQASWTPILGFLGNLFHDGADFLSRPPVLTLLLTIGLPGILLLVLMVHISSQPAPVERVAVEPAHQAELSRVVAEVTRTHECVWDEAEPGVSAGSPLTSGQLLQLREGLVEVTFVDGARVILEGPATFDVNTGAQGFLRAGRLVANVPKGAEGFAIVTPSATVVDLGTEFGVFVEPKKRTAQVQVFQGSVELKVGKEVAGREPVRRRVEAGQAFRVEPIGLSGKSVIQEIAPPVDRFVRRVPRPGESTQRLIVADFSGGNGFARADQFPGTSGDGWASGWNIYLQTLQKKVPVTAPIEKFNNWGTQQFHGLKYTAVAEQANPILGGGDYLRVLLERESGTDTVCTGIVRRLDLSANRIDFTKPHVISFAVRVDALDQFNDLDDHIYICDNSKAGSEPRDKGYYGWGIRLYGKAWKGVKAGNWSFASCDARGRESLVDSGIPAREGTVYLFRVSVDPRDRVWNASISVDGGPPATFKPLRMRAIGNDEQSADCPFLYFVGRVGGGNQGPDRERLGFSIDSIQITPAE